MDKAINFIVVKLLKGMSGLFMVTHTLSMRYTVLKQQLQYRQFLNNLNYNYLLQL